MYLISAEGYKNAGVYSLRIQKTGKVWPTMKDVGNGMGIKNISDLVLKEIHSVLETKTLKKSKLTNAKWQKEKFMKSLVI